VSSSGGGLPGRLELERVQGARYFWTPFSLCAIAELSIYLVCGITRQQRVSW
jgi:hypothetical protein